MKFVLIYILIPSLILISNPLDYYRLHFQERKKHPLHDTLFEKSIHRRKVSEILIEERSNNQFLVTLLMISPYPHNYKSLNYPIHYRFNNWQDAYKKFIWLDNFLDTQGIARVFLKGSFIVKETILFEGY